MINMMSKPAQALENIVSNSQSIDTSSVEQLSPTIQKKKESMPIVDNAENITPENATIIE